MMRNEYFCTVILNFLLVNFGNFFKLWEQKWEITTIFVSDFGAQKIYKLAILKASFDKKFVSHCHQLFWTLWFRTFSSSRNKKVKISVSFSLRCYIRESVELEVSQSRKNLQNWRTLRERERETKVKFKMKVNKVASIFAIYFTVSLLNSIDARWDVFVFKYGYVWLQS